MHNEFIIDIHHYFLIKKARILSFIIELILVRHIIINYLIIHKTQFDFWILSSRENLLRFLFCKNTRNICGLIEIV